MGEKIADEMNPILGMYRMPTPAYYLRGVYPMGDLKCIVKMKSNEMPVSVPTHMDKIIRVDSRRREGDDVRTASRRRKVTIRPQVERTDVKVMHRKISKRHRCGSTKLMMEIKDLLPGKIFTRTIRV